MATTGFIGLVFASALAAHVTFAAQNPPQDRGTARETKASDELTVTGCLTANVRGDRFVLTPLKKDPLAAEMTTRTTDAAPTYTYELRGGTNLRAHIGQQVSVTGILDRSFEKDAELDRERETQATPVKPGAPTPSVETEEKAELELRRLHVKTVKSIGKPCATPTS